MLDVRHEVHVESLWGTCLSVVQKHLGLARLASLPDGIRSRPRFVEISAVKTLISFKCQRLQLIMRPFRRLVTGCDETTQAPLSRALALRHKVLYVELEVWPATHLLKIPIMRTPIAFMASLSFIVTRSEIPLLPLKGRSRYSLTTQLRSEISARPFIA